MSETAALAAHQLVDSLRWRYATKVFDSSRKISAADWEALEEALVLSPSSYGLQPWKFLVITDPSVRAKLVPHSWNQKQVVDCSHFVVFLVRQNIGKQEIERWVEQIARVRGLPVESLTSYRDIMVGDLVNGPRSSLINHWAARQVYIALGNFMTSAAVMGIDTCPMEGIDPPKYDETLNLTGSHWATLVACAAGYRSPKDKYASLPKVRFARDHVIEHR